MSGGSVTAYSPALATRLDQADANTLYIGKAQPGTLDSADAWQIRKMITTGGVTQFLWANGSAEFKANWSNRASLSYS